MGLALIWKSAGPGSQDFLGRFKKDMGLPGPARKDIGHSGTLDPFAEGLLLVGWDEGTKLLSALTGMPKTYIAEVEFGLSSDTLDNTGNVVAWSDFNNDDYLALTDEILAAFLEKKIGPGQQRPPAFSAIKVDGKRSYDLARSGKVVEELPLREFEILKAKHLSLRAAEHLGVKTLRWTFEIEVSSGTYIRALARDWSLELLGRPALLSRLIRSAIGPYSVSIPEKYLSSTVETVGPLGFESFYRAQKPLADSAPECLVRHLDLADLGQLFATQKLGADAARKLRINGHWQKEDYDLSLASKYLILDEKDQIIAWCEGQTGRLGRVFSTNPLMQAHESFETTFAVNSK